MNDKYHAFYKFEARPEGVPRIDIPDGWGACDALLITSIIYGADGSVSTAFIGMDGTEAGPLKPYDYFRTWSMLADTLANHEGLSEQARQICRESFQMVKSRMLGR